MYPLTLKRVRGFLHARVMKDTILASGGFTEVKSHGIMPIAGTIQFGFKVRFREILSE
jgi:hypothetical protein